eukprot:1147995-Pelagomonas_calceolata.AAC.16
MVLVRLQRAYLAVELTVRIFKLPWESWKRLYRAKVCRGQGAIGFRQAAPSPKPSSCTSMRVLSGPVPAGAVPWAWNGQAGLRHVEFLLPMHNTCSNQQCPLHRPATKTQPSRSKTFAWQACQVSGRGVRWVGQGSRR